MSAVVKILKKLEGDMFAHYEAELISENPITAQVSGEGKSPITKTANKGDTVYLDIEPVSKNEFEIDKEYDINYVQSLYAKNTTKPIILTITIIR